MTTFRYPGAMIVPLLTILAVLTVPGHPVPVAAQATQPQTSFTIYLPSAAKAKDNAPPVSNPGTDPGTAQANILLPYHLGGGIMTSIVPQIAIDAAGGTHVVYTSNAPDSTGRRPAYYAYCPANCTSTDSYTVATLGDAMTSAQLALDPAGHPRLLLLSTTTDANGDSPAVYTYATCDQACTQAENWTLTPVLQAIDHDFFNDAENNQWFALDAQGNPRFVYYINSWHAADGVAGTYLAFCNAGCTDPASWYATKLTDDEWHGPQLAITPEGLPRIAAVTKRGYDGYTELSYIECTAPDCSAGGIGDVVQGATYRPGSALIFSLRLDSNGLPRLAFFPGVGTGGDFAANRLYYLACDADCTDGSANWHAVDLGFPRETNGSTNYDGDFGVALALNRQNQPRIAYRAGGTEWWDLKYAWCNQNCTQVGADWRSQVLPSNKLTEDELGSIRHHCTDCFPPIQDCVSGWDSGYWPSLALDAADNPRIAFEVHLRSGGGCTAKTLARVSRVVSFTQP